MSGYYQFQMYEFQRKAMSLLGDQNLRKSRLAVKRTVRDIGYLEAQYAKDIVDDEVSDSGRLAASIGYYDQSYLKKSNTGSSPADAYFAEFTAGNRYVVEFGSNVEYATPIMLGFTMSERRVVFSTRMNKFITVKPFTFDGIFAYERAHNMVQSDYQRLIRIFKKNARELELSWNRG